MPTASQRYLITTADERTWRTDGPVLFLGDWCMLYARRSACERLDWEMVPYHWKDRSKFRRDYDHLSEVYERLLPKLARYLNAMHGTDASDRYWRILVGPWLCYFVQIVYDRWSSIHQAVHEFGVSGTTVLTGQEKEMVPNDMDHFYDLIPSDAWNHHLYAFILRHYTSVPIIEVSDPEPPSRRNKTQTGGYRLLKRIYKDLASRFIRDRDAVFVATYLPNTGLTRLYLRFRQVPQYLSPCEPVQVDVDWRQRDRMLEPRTQRDFEDCLLKLVPKQIPRLFLEGYPELVAQVAQLPWPRRPKAIFTSNAMWFDTVAMAYMAKKADDGIPVLCGQHGGVYGVADFSFAEEHEVAASNRFLTWGWTEAGQEKLVAVGMLKPVRERCRPVPDGRLLLVGISTFSRYSYILTSESSIDFSSYMERCFLFAESLPESIRDQLLVRLTARDVGWSQGARWQERFPDVEVDLGKATMPGLMEKARLVVCTYNSTNFLEAIASNTPTVMFCDLEESPLRDSAEPFFRDLVGVGIVHLSAKSAADHIAEVWDDVERWWNRVDVRQSLDRFRDRFCRNTPDVVRHVESAIRAEIAVSAGVPI